VRRFIDHHPDQAVDVLTGEEFTNEFFVRAAETTSSTPSAARCATSICS
jgi:hypothetical protein